MKAKFINKIDRKIFIPSLLVLAVIIIPLYLFPERMGEIISALFSFCTGELGWMFILANLLSFGFLLWLSFSRYGKVRLGDKDEKPRYRDPSWVAMLFTAGVGTSIVILGFLEPIHYLSTPPLDIAPMSKEAYEFAHMYGQFHWGLSAWAFYNPAVIGVAYMLFVRKSGSMRLSSACKSILGKRADGWLGAAIDILVVFGIVGSISTSLGIAVPVMGEVLQTAFGIPDSFSFFLKIAVLLIWMLLFGGSVYLGLDKGIRRLSGLNMVFAFAFMALIFVLGPGMKTIRMEINSLGLYVQNFIRMSTNMDPFGDGAFVNDWTVFYWAWWVAFLPMMGIFVGRISRGRTIRQVIWGQMLWGSAGCCVSFMIFGGYSLTLQHSGKVDLVSILASKGQSGAIVAILNTLPLPRVMMVFFCVLCFIYLATTIDSSAYVLAGVTTERLSPDEDPARWNRVLWAALFSLLSIGLMIIGGLEAVKTISVITGLPLIAVFVLLILSLRKMLKEDDPGRGDGQDP